MSSHATRLFRCSTRPVAVACLGVAWGCAPVAPVPTAPCHAIELPAATGPSGSPIPCTDDVECPPPLICGAVEEGTGMGCTLGTYGTEPELMAEVFDRPRLPLELTDPLQGDGLVIKWQAPANARQIRCAIFGCTLTHALLSRGLERCVILDVQRDTALGDSIIVTPRAQSSPGELNPETRLTTCSSGDRTLLYTVSELNLACWAFSDTDLVAVSPVVRLSPRQLGRYRDRYIATDCSAPPIVPGAACLIDPDTPRLGVCSARRCCAPCWADEQCADHASRCVPVQTASDEEAEDLPGPYIGVCAGSCGGPSPPEGDAALDPPSDAGVPDAAPAGGS